MQKKLLYFLFVKNVFFSLFYKLEMNITKGYSRA